MAKGRGGGQAGSAVLSRRPGVSTGGQRSAGRCSGRGKRGARVSGGAGVASCPSSCCRHSSGAGRGRRRRPPAQLPCLAAVSMPSLLLAPGTAAAPAGCEGRAGAGAWSPAAGQPAGPPAGSREGGRGEARGPCPVAHQRFLDLGVQLGGSRRHAHRRSLDARQSTRKRRGGRRLLRPNIGRRELRSAGHGGRGLWRGLWRGRREEEREGGAAQGLAVHLDVQLQRAGGAK